METSSLGRWLDRLRTIARPVLPPPPIIGAMLTDTGLVRDSNEDNVMFTLPGAEAPGLAVLADGMGGHSAGEVASGIAVSTIPETFFASHGTVPQRLGAAFQAAHAAIRAHVRTAPETAGMGSTCTALAFADGGVFLAHIGDSRAYLLRERVLQQISEDHSLVASLVRAGRLTPEEAANSPDKNVILAALGISDQIKPQISGTRIAVQPGDVFVLCSDGLSDLVSPPDIESALCVAQSPEEACARLVEAAKAAGGHDNISVGVFKVGGAPETETAGALRDTREVRLDVEPG